MSKKKYIRLVVLFQEDDKRLLTELKRVSKKYRLSLSALASYSIQTGLPFVEAHFEKMSGKTKVSK